jgi:hypothetical protein
MIERAILMILLTCITVNLHIVIDIFSTILPVAFGQYQRKNSGIFSDKERSPKLHHF